MDHRNRKPIPPNANADNTCDVERQDTLVNDFATQSRINVINMPSYESPRIDVTEESDCQPKVKVKNSTKTRSKLGSYINKIKSRKS